MGTVTYDADVIRDGKWWIVEIPALDGLTQARRLGEAELMAREWIAVNEDLELEDVKVTLRRVIIDGDDFGRVRDEVAVLRAQVAEIENRIAGTNRKYADVLVSRAIPIRDIAEVLGVSFQRVSQILNAARPAMVVRNDTTFSQHNVLLRLDEGGVGSSNDTVEELVVVHTPEADLSSH